MSGRRTTALRMLLLAALALTATIAMSTATPPVGAQTSEARVNQVQFLGTHNSYHKFPTNPVSQQVPDWQYEHSPLDVQLAQEGVRQFEIDIHYDQTNDRFLVYHVWGADGETTCELLTDCLSTFRDWSDANPGHCPVMVFIEPKDGRDAGPTDIEQFEDSNPDEGPIAGHYDLLDQVILAELGSRVLTPDELQGSAASVRDAVTTTGWPTLSDAAGRFIFSMLDTGSHRDDYTTGGTTLAGRSMFADPNDADGPIAAVLRVDGPVGKEAEIQALVNQGFLVRTRSDAGTEGQSGDTTRLEAALASGAQYISTDHPTASRSESGYFADIPGDGIGRLNPINGTGQSAPGEVCATELGITSATDVTPATTIAPTVAAQNTTDPLPASGGTEVALPALAGIGLALAIRRRSQTRPS